MTLTVAFQDPPETSDTVHEQEGLMRRLVLFCIVALVGSQAAGCFISSDDDDVIDDDLGFIKADWDFETVAGGALNCPAGFATVKVEARGTENIDDLFDCTDFTGTSPDGHIIGNYDVQIIVADIDDVGNELDRYGESLLFDVDLVPGDVLVDELFIDDGGRLTLGVDLVTGATPEDCASGGVDAIGFNYTGTGAIQTDEAVACGEDLITPPLLSDTYTVSIDALDAAGEPINSTAANVPNVVVTDPNGYTDLGTVTIDLL